VIKFAPHNHVEQTLSHKVEITLFGEDYSAVSKALDCVLETSHFFKDLICEKGLDYKEQAKNFSCEIKWSVEKKEE
jgi:hypothetical protein